MTDEYKNNKTYRTTLEEAKRIHDECEGKTPVKIPD
jgi:hypothetical protein